ncbi:hypothetical protein PYCCODRAFT_1451679 [Trametes coccinea BRFM310]|uniref:RlpA-like protein double-psi beta-barrel domain-containing protein n=1 Tax=Trametes coccinea (strain BRFM310) TaxID=1353009 RepID=A0A1Y2IR41_TRAC3|nr:hypothetical protein PYCCODRAFT_1451679 [Trametes coccinea BRFM310]
MASPHMPRRVDHHGLARRAAIPVAEPEPVLAAPRRKRSSTGRCKVRSTSSAAPSSTAAPTSSAIVVPQNVESDPASTSTPATTATPTSTPAETKPTSTPAETKPTSTATPSTTHHSSSAAPATSSAASTGSSSDEPSYMTGTQTGDGTYYSTGLGSCGITNQDSDHIVAVSHLLYDSYPGYTGANPNNNPVCGRKITATYQGKSVEVTVTDRCTGCAETDLDFSPSAFSELADFAVGRLHGMTWVWSS